MITRLIFPYIFLGLIIAGYLIYRKHKLGPVLLKVDRTLFSRYSTDSLLLVMVIGAASFFLGRFELQGIPPDSETAFLSPYAYLFFYGILMLTVIAREVERPALREKGISTSRGFWQWTEVDSYRWSRNVLTINIVRGKKKRAEVWPVKPEAKKNVDQIMKKMVPKRSGRSKKKS